MKNKIIEIIGWYGAAAILIAYAGVSFGYILPSDLIFQILNFTGAIGIVVVSFSKKTYQPGVLNLIWAIVALFALISISF